jgi:hypothetical protein
MLRRFMRPDRCCTLHELCRLLLQHFESMVDVGGCPFFGNVLSQPPGSPSPHPWSRCGISVDLLLEAPVAVSAAGHCWKLKEA